MPDEQHKPRFSVDARIDALERQLAEQRMQADLARHEALASARMTAPEIRAKRKRLNWLFIVLAVLILAVVGYFVFRPSAPTEGPGLEDDGWALPGAEPLPDAPELPDLDKLRAAETARPSGGRRPPRKTAAPDLLEGIEGLDTRDPTAGLPE